MAAMAFCVEARRAPRPLTLIGAACCAGGPAPVLGVYDVVIFWVAGAALVAAGYYMTVKPIVDKRIAG